MIAEYYNLPGALELDLEYSGKCDTPDPDARRLMRHALDAAWKHFLGLLGATPLDAHGMRATMERRIASAVAMGERDHKRLKLIGLGVFEPPVG